jgi:EAL domain-containing protein (putative c-di-GMP-specific phosphodiesterase class I)
MNPAVLPDANRRLAYLEHYPEPGIAQGVWLEHFPFQIGRKKTADYVIISSQVSKEHAEVCRVGDAYLIRDVGSTNGTYVNGQRVTEAVLVHGDIIHVAHKEFRFGYGQAEAPVDSEVRNTAAADGGLPPSIMRGTWLLREMLTGHRVRIVFQPIICLATQKVAAYEALGRGAHDQLSPNPCDLFDLAERCQLAGRLSRLFRMMAVQEAFRLPAEAHVFFNLHPSELEDAAFISSLGETRSLLRGGQRMVLEIHEDVVADTKSLSGLRRQLRELDIGLAFDDFGAGQTRLTELAEVPPDFIKLDLKLIRGLDQARARQELVQAIIQVGTSLGVQIIAEGVETREEAEVCRRLGCQYAQGFLFGRPQPALLLAPRTERDTIECDISPVKDPLLASRPDHPAKEA